MVPSIYADGTNVNVAYNDWNTGTGQYSGLKIASFLPSGSTLPMSPSDVNLGTNAVHSTTAPTYYPSLSMAGPTLCSYYDQSAKTLRCYEYLTYAIPPLLMLHFDIQSIDVDTSSSNVGQNSNLLYSAANSTACIAYYDAANKALKFARGQQDHSRTPPDFVFTTSTIASVGGSNFDCSLATDGTSLYIVYYDSANGGGLKIAKSTDGGLTW